MEKLQELKQERGKLAEKMLAIVDVAEKEGRGLTNEERSNWDGMRIDLDNFDEQITGLNDALELARSIAIPSNPLPPETRKYDDLGFPVVKRGGDDDDDENDDESIYNEAFGALIRSDQPGMLDLKKEHREALRSKIVIEKRAGGISPGSAGGFLVPSTLSSQIIEIMKAYGGIRKYATVMKTSSGDQYGFPIGDDTGNEGELVAEHAQSSEGDFSFGQKALGAFKYSSKVVRISVELLQDSAFSLDSYIVKQFGKRLGRITSRHYLKGTGNDQPTGLLTAAAVGHTAGSTSIDYGDLLRLKHSVDAAYREIGNCRWGLNDKTLLQIKEMVDSNKRPLWRPSIADGAPNLIDGDPYFIDNSFDEPGACSRCMAYGDFSEFVIRDVMGFTLHRMVEKYIDYGQIGFLAFMRTDSNLMDAEAVKVLAMPGGKAKL